MICLDTFSLIFKQDVSARLSQYARFCLDFQSGFSTDSKCKALLICLDFQPDFLTDGKCKALLICLDFWTDFWTGSK